VLFLGWIFGVSASAETGFLSNLRNLKQICKGMEEFDQKSCNSLNHIIDEILKSLDSENTCRLLESDRKKQDVFKDRFNETESFEEFSKNLKTAVNYFDGLPPKVLWELIYCIETKETKWKDNCNRHRNGPFEHEALEEKHCKFSSKHTPIRVEFDEKCEQIFLSNFGVILGEGWFKRYETGIEYKKWKPLARGELKKPDNLKAAEDWEYERSILNEIMTWPSKQQVGLVQTYYADPRRVFQPRYEDMITFLNSPSAEQVDLLSRLQIGRQLSRGLENFHLKGMVHRDIKPDNIVLKDLQSPMRVEGRYTDFGLAFNATTRVEQGNLPARGTTSYFAPEQLNSVPIGNSVAEKVENAKKADVFSQAISLLLLMEIEPMTVKKLTVCLQNRKGNFEYCSVILKELKDNLQSHYPDEASLFRKALEVNPKDRSSAAEFRKGFDQLSQQAFWTALDKNYPSGRVHRNSTNALQVLSSENKKYVFFVGENEERGTLQVKLALRLDHGETKIIPLESNPFDKAEAKKEFDRVRKENGF
jgi:hypothetical protein